MCQSDDGHSDATDSEVACESADYWQTRFKDAEVTVSRLSARLRGRDQRILLLERALARTVALHHALEDSLEQRLERCSMQIQRGREPDMTSHTPTDPPERGVIVRLPHLTRTLSQLFDVMWAHWAEWDPERPPKSSTVARAIDARLGLKGQANGEASRSAQTFAAALRPDSVNDTDGRHH
ncbi:hypothetical protein [Burkholderia multivorans]|uniref:hypothetical protein n=1 Tax=Burkholderia multivorans TaxID=87883 RepID=UPI0019D1A34F|nr:hypothetical protein [Burkholderia multivorans]MBN7129799.1 hypothetical protein [Burkholderia multivorans]QSL25764.1 hypothetical protein G0D92_11470 [Burkholderia multivorans]